ncbi:unnamed protein product [marine sediment metagenome]|uniref:Uncharacterized protein n=1 Tax=marine sediment metagenome TaxID=412755 RepID=X1RUV0_9ZZZZ
MPKNREPPRIQSFSVPSEKEHVLAWIDEMAKRERKSKSQVVIRCVEYYYHKKWPGNPQPPLMSSIKPEFVRKEALREARLRKAIIFLRFKAKLSYDQVAMVVQKNREYIRRFIKRLDPQLHSVNMNGRRIQNKRLRSRSFKKNLLRYRKKMEEWLAGKHETIEEAFTW